MSIEVSIVVRDANQKGRKVPVADILIINDASGDKERGNYRYAIKLRPGQDDEDLIAGEIKNFRRAHPNGALQLLKQILTKEFHFEPETMYRDIPR